MRTIFVCPKDIRVALLGFNLPCINVLNSYSIYKELSLIVTHIVDLTLIPYSITKIYQSLLLIIIKV